MINRMTDSSIDQLIDVDKVQSVVGCDLAHSDC